MNELLLRRPEKPEELQGLMNYRSVFVLSAADSLLQNSVNIIKKLQGEGAAGVFVGVNRPYPVMEKYLLDGGIDINKIYFIDCISKSAGAKVKTGATENCLYINSPGSLTELSISVMQALELFKEQKKYVFFDSMGTFLMYTSAEAFSKFSHFLITKISVIDVNGVFMSIEREMEPKLVSELESFCQKTIRL